MKPLEREKLLDEILADDNLAQLRQASLREGLGLLRRQRRRRLALRAAVPAMAVCMLGLGLWVNSRHTQAHLAMIRPPQPARSSGESAGRVRYLSDDELLALFPNRPVALVGRPGRQRLVFLDQVRQR